MQANLDQYVDLVVSENIYSWIYNASEGADEFKMNKTRTAMIPCPIGRLGI